MLELAGVPLDDLDEGFHHAAGDQRFAARLVAGDVIKAGSRGRRGTRLSSTTRKTSRTCIQVVSRVGGHPVGALGVLSGVEGGTDGAVGEDGGAEGRLIASRS